MQRQLQALEDHHIVCGSGPTAIYAATELVTVQRPVVLIAATHEAAERVRAELPDIPIILGDPTDDDILLAAGADKAAGLVACTDSDNENVVVTLTARQLNPRLRIVTRMDHVDTVSKAKKVGANSAVSPSHIGGLRLASELVRPTVVDFLDAMLRDRELNLRIDEVRVPAESPMVGKKLTDLRLEELPDALLIALRDKGAWRYNPPRSVEMRPGLVLILLGAPDDVQAVRERVGGGAPRTAGA